jgi:hypothetical protein
VIPIVFLGVSDPIGSGFIASMARPGANMTGILNFEASITGKWLLMLKEIEPRLARAAFLANPKTTPYEYFLQAAREVAATLAIELVPSPVTDAADIERVIAAFAETPNGGLLLPPDITTLVHRDLIIVLAGAAPSASDLAISLRGRCGRPHVLRARPARCVSARLDAREKAPARQPQSTARALRWRSHPQSGRGRQAAPHSAG